jgi:hypothetical protein
LAYNGRRNYVIKGIKNIRNKEMDWKYFRYIDFWSSNPIKIRFDLYHYHKIDFKKIEISEYYDVAMKLIWKN